MKMMIAWWSHDDDDLEADLDMISSIKVKDLNVSPKLGGDNLDITYDINIGRLIELKA